jgi:NhaP-type Na+/H+ or K+/H+ antiporter
VVSLIAGVIFSPHAANWIRPLEYALGDQETLNIITLYFTRLVLGVQLVIAGVQLPSRYLRLEWKSLFWLLGPGMAGMWILTSLLVWALVPNIEFLYALAIGACVTPTDPILSNTIVKGKFADKNIPKELQKIIIAESGTNDGLGYPFLFLPLYLIRYARMGEHSSGTAVGMWFYETWVYQIVLGAVYGAVVGWLAKELLHWAEERKYVDRESFLVFAIALALFIVGTCGMIGSDDVLACFIAGNTFTWDDWFRLETQDDSLQPTIDMLFNIAVFVWFGAVCPWYEFAHNNVIPLYRLVFLGILILLIRRPPVVLLMHKKIHQIEEWRQALFVGFFGPIGVSAIFYLYVSLEYLRTSVQDHGHERADAKRLGETMNVVIWFLVICSVVCSHCSGSGTLLIWRPQVVHGLTIPLGKLGFYIPRTLSQALSQNEDEPSFVVQPGSSTGFNNLQRLGRSVIRHRDSGVSSRAASRRTSRHVTPHPGRSPQASSSDLPADSKIDIELANRPGEEPSDEICSSEDAVLQMSDPIVPDLAAANDSRMRMIRFPDEARVHNNLGGSSARTPYMSVQGDSTP